MKAINNLIQFRLGQLNPANVKLLLLVIILVLSILIGGAPEGNDLPGN